MRRIQEEFKWKGIDYSIIERNDKAIILEASASFYDSPSVEVWKVRVRPASKVGERVIDAGEIKPSDEDFPSYAKQYFEKRYSSKDEMMKRVFAAYDKFSEEEE